jgi:hypothetical protein
VTRRIFPLVSGSSSVNVGALGLGLELREVGRADLDRVLGVLDVVDVQVAAGGDVEVAVEQLAARGRADREVLDELRVAGEAVARGLRGGGGRDEGEEGEEQREEAGHRGHQRAAPPLLARYHSISS